MRTRPRSGIPHPVVGVLALALPPHDKWVVSFTNFSPKLKENNHLVCAVASKYYDANPELHPRLSELSQKLAFSVPAKVRS